MSDRWRETRVAGLLAFAPDRPRPASRRRAAVFVDRDGVLNKLVPSGAGGPGRTGTRHESPLTPAQVRLIDGAAGALRGLARAGFAIVCVTNQPAAAKHETSVERLQAVHERVLALLDAQGGRLDASRLCLHHPEGTDAQLSWTCPCRKPRPGMLLDAAEALDLDLRASWMIGDTDADVAAGLAAGCRTILLEHPDSAHKRSHAVRAHLLAADLVTAARLLGQWRVSASGRTLPPVTTAQARGGEPRGSAHSSTRESQGSRPARGRSAPSPP
ncbi:MAG TPA: HAD-IIIA family hydrolase [Solirubrobacteraceae bacterium]|nr:HAD-IIIA family hydrolase [Solirubrobacteraceae bacterium]